MKISEQQIFQLIYIAKGCSVSELVDDESRRKISSLLRQIYSQQSGEVKEIGDES